MNIKSMYMCLGKTCTQNLAVKRLAHSKEFYEMDLYCILSIIGYFMIVVGAY